MLPLAIRPMSLRPITVSALFATVLLAGAGRADADLTAFLGANTTPANRPVRGLAVGLSFMVVGVEFEYSDTNAGETGGARRRAGMFNVLAQTPNWFNSMQFYGTVGGGLYREEGAGLLETRAATNTGGGMKIDLVGPFRARFDYRIFVLRGGSAADRTQHRFYTGLVLAF